MQQQAVGDSPRYSRVCVSSSSQQQTPQLPPSLPPRSPLRPRPSSIVSTPLDDKKAAREEEIAMAYASLTGMAAAVVVDREKPLPEVEDEDEVKTTTTTTTSLTKRQHALHELLSSERAYASDLALVREVHIPLALGQQIPHSLPVSPPNSSGSSSRTHSTASDASSSSAAAAAVATTAELGPPMSPDDVKIIFSNITEIAVFSDLFCQALEEALGDLLEGGKGDDHVGALFLSIIPELERLYKQYITRHPTALNHLQQLPQTPAVQNYLSYTQTIASSLSHAWDLSSLLIKPVQRLLKYPLLLAAIIDETSDFHPDKDNLVKARKQMEEVARNVNEGRRRAEVVRDVLTSKKKPGVAGGHGVTVAASVNLTKVKSLRVNPGLRNGAGGGSKDEKTPEEAILVEKLEEELKQIEFFAQQFAKHIVEWARSTSTVVLSLRTWSLSFAKVIGLTPEQGSEAFDAFLVVVEKQLMPLCVDLEAVINEKVLKELAHLLMTMNQPLKLLASMNEQEPYHHHLMNMTVSQKNRPPPSLLAASTNYLALRGQLAAELPMYIALLHKGLRIFVYRLTAIQTEFWSKVRDQWLGLWEMLRLEEELNVGHEETISVWNARWVDIAEVLASMSIVQDPQVVYQQLKEKVRSGRAGAGGGVDKRESRERERELRERERERERERIERERIERERDIGEEYDAEYYVQHHLQAFAHRQSNMPETHTRNPNYVGPPHRNSTATSTSGGGGSHQQRTPPQGYYTPSIPPSSPPSTIQSMMFSDGPPNSPNSFTTSVTSSISGGGDRRDSRDQQGYSQSHYHAHHPRTHSRDPREHRERDRHEREKKKSSAQAANAISLLGALEPSPAISPKSPKSPKKGGGDSPVNVSGRRRGNSDVSSFVSGASGSGSGSGGSTAGGGGLGSWMGSVGMGGTFGASGGIVTGISSTTSGSGSGGGGGKKGVQKKVSNDSFVSKGTTATIRSPAPQHSLSSPPSSSRPHQSSPRQPTPHPGSHPHPPHQNRRRALGGGVEPAPEDLREYEVVMMREKGEHGSRPGTAGTTTSNNARSPNPNLNVNEYHHNHHPGLPRTKSMPLPYHPQHPQQRPPSQRHSSTNNTTAGHQHYHHQGGLYSQLQQQQQMKRSAGDWSMSAECADDQEDIELFYHSQSQLSYHDVAGHDVSHGYERERDRDQEYEMRNTARPRERPRDTSTGMSGHRNRSERERSAKGHSHSRQRSVGKDSDERKSYSEHSTYSNKSRDGKGDKDREKDRDKDKDKDKPSSSSRKRSGSIKSITSFFTSTNRNSDSHDRQNIGDISSTSLTQVPSTTTTTLTDHTPSPRDSWALKPAKYTCVVIHPCKPPTTGPNSTPLSYFSFPFFTLEKGELYDVLQEAGHPSLHPNLPLIVDEGEDCLLLCRSRWDVDRVGWALASFLEPCSTSEE